MITRTTNKKQDAPKRARVYRQFVFVGRTAEGKRIELVSQDDHEIEVQAGMLQATGILTYHNVKVWSKGTFVKGVRR